MTADQRLENLTRGQHNRKLNRDSTTGHKNITRHKGAYEVTVAGVYIGRRKYLKDAIALRDAERKRVMIYEEKVCQD